MRKIFIFLLAIFSLYESAFCNDAPYIIPKVNKNPDSLMAASRIAMSGMEAQSERLKVISQNIANANVTGTGPGDDAYKRKIIFFENQKDPSIGGEVVKVKKKTF